MTIILLIALFNINHTFRKLEKPVCSPEIVPITTYKHQPMSVSVMNNV